jgi:hypothetical protein
VFYAWEDGIFISLNPGSIFQHQCVHLHIPSNTNFTTGHKLQYHLPQQPKYHSFHSINFRLQEFCCMLLPKGDAMK